MESNSSVKLLDLSGCQVSAATCLVLVETLSSNKVLEQLVLQENPLGRAGAQRLLKAVHAGELCVCVSWGVGGGGVRNAVAAESGARR
jgi:Ran GTPase-activating protein (RanGAP) involved in mRNA processing and transport